MDHWTELMHSRTVNSPVISTPRSGTSSVSIEDVAELARAYMGSRPSNISPSRSIVPRATNLSRVCGRSAIYRMARTPYSRVYPTSTHKGAGVGIEGEPSSSAHHALDYDILSGSKQGALKRTNSVLDNDIGYFGPIRRIRHKSNGLIPLPSKSSELESKIHQQLDKLVPPKEKSSELRLPTVIVDSDSTDGLIPVDSDTTVPRNQVISVVKSGDLSASEPVSYPPPKKKAFRISAHEDYLELDDDAYPNGSEPPFSTSVKETTTSTSTTVAEKSASATENPASSEMQPGSSVVMSSKNLTADDKLHVRVADSSIVDEKVAVIASTSASGPPFSFTSAAAIPNLQPASTNTQPAFGSSAPGFAIGSVSVNNDQMSMEDSMAEDTVQATPPATPVFGQQPGPVQSNFVLGASTPTPANPFQFVDQQSIAPQNPSPFQASGSLEFSAAGGSFSLGTSGGDKSGRRIVKVKHNRQRKISYNSSKKSVYDD